MSNIEIKGEVDGLEKSEVKEKGQERSLLRKMDTRKVRRRFKIG